MNLQLLRAAPGISIYYDTCNDWLFVDWQGDLSLRTIQLASLELAQCVLVRPYARVLNSNLLVTSISWDVAPWLLTELLPHLRLAGVEHLAWVRPETLRGQQLVNAMLSRLPGLCVCLFDEMDQAVTWLQRHRAPATQSCTSLLHSPETQAKLEQLVQTVARKLRL
jgi:hypothetical protein